MMRETERGYVVGHHNIDQSGRWEQEGGYFPGLGDDTSTVSNDSSTWVDALTAVLPVAASIYQQDQFAKMNRDLISAGKPPLSATQYTAMYPTASVQVGPTADAKKWIVYGGIGLLALVGLRAAKII